MVVAEHPSDLRAIVILERHLPSLYINIVLLSHYVGNAQYQVAQRW
jgi:hypothetical protein